VAPIAGTPTYEAEKGIGAPGGEPLETDPLGVDVLLIPIPAPPNAPDVALKSAAYVTFMASSERPTTMAS
jgi:hypothetical protein